ncbi:hypothetical protein [Kordia sp.]|uniref:hypothetical protein n=1 Tax=Kordia sp. TaxID=1965332 RepID=UPI003D2B5DFD
MKKKNLKNLTLKKNAIAHLKGGKAEGEENLRSIYYYCTIITCPSMQYSCMDPYCTIA